MKPAWLKLIEEWQSSTHFGLTIPFVVGALRIWPGRPLGYDVGIEEVRSLLTSVRDEVPQGVFMRIYSCEKVQALVLARVGAYPAYCLEFPSPKNSNQILFVEKSVMPEGNASFEELVATLWQQYAVIIKNEEFSRQDGYFQSFSAADMDLVQRAIARSDDDEDN